jgi:hypothetical protein
MSGVVIAESAGVVLVENGPLIYFVDRRTGGLSIAVFVIALVAVIAGVNGGVLLAGGHAAGAVVLGVAVLAVAVLVLVLRSLRRQRGRSLEHLPRTLIIDRDAGVVLRGDGRTLAQLDAVRFVSVFQLGSSSRALACEHPGGRVVVCRGSPFSGSIGPHLEALRGRGLGLRDAQGEAARSAGRERTGR